MNTIRPLEQLRYALIALVLTTSLVLWTAGFMQSPVLHPTLVEQHHFIDRFIKENGPDYQKESVLAKAYWKRYPDVRQDSYYGAAGPLGIFGAREHFQQHGKREKRIYAPIAVPDDLTQEQQLAEAYWTRYPVIEKSAVWGRKSSLGILGPRDHFIHFGKKEGAVWPVLPGNSHKTTE
jgi:hypothetical protein